MGDVSNSGVEEVRAALKERIIDVIQKLYPDAKREGTTYRIPNVTGTATAKAKDKPNNPSLSIEVVRAGAKGSWNDFSTKEKGGIIDLIMASRKVSFWDALRWACEFLVMPMPHRSPSTPLTLEGTPLDTANPRALQDNKRRLSRHQEAKAYLTGERRGLTPQTIGRRPRARSADPTGRSWCVAQGRRSAALGPRRSPGSPETP